jgi:hypothetical protein
MDSTFGGVREPVAYFSKIHGLTVGPPPPGWFDIPANLREIPAAEFWRHTP